MDSKPFVSAHLAEGPGSFIQATIFYRDMYAKNSKNDKYHAITLHSENKNVPRMEEKFIGYYAKEKPRRFMQHVTYPQKVASSDPKKDNGDITNPKTINLFKKEMGKNRAMLVTADGGFPWKNENMQEQEAMRLVLGQITAAVEVQAKGGHFVCKVFETYTIPMVKIICMLAYLYEEVIITKPFMSRQSNSEKYFVCKNYTGNTLPLMDTLAYLLKKPQLHIYDIFPKYDIPKHILDTVTDINVLIANKQYISINNIVAYVKKENYKGQVYKERRALQIKSSIQWIETFFN